MAKCKPPPKGIFCVVILKNDLSMLSTRYRRLTICVWFSFFFFNTMSCKDFGDLDLSEFHFLFVNYHVF